MLSLSDEQNHTLRIISSFITLMVSILLSAPAFPAPWDPIDPDTPWRANPTPSQVPGVQGISTGRPDTLMFAFERWNALTNPEDRRANVYMQPAIDNMALHCGAAGVEGPVVWSADLEIIYPNAILARLIQSDIQPVDPASGCDVTINDMESLQAAVRKRLIYIEYVRDGVRKRGQLSPQSVGLLNPGGFLSSSSYSTPVSATALWFGGTQQRTLDTVRWAAYYRAYWGLDMTLRCGPAGIDGEIVAHLDPPGGRGQLSGSDIVPTDGQGACGMVVNNIASLFEALLRGHLYIAYSPRCNGQAEPCGYDVVTARAQFPSYNNPDQSIRDWLSW